MERRRATLAAVLVAIICLVAACATPSNARVTVDGAADWATARATLVRYATPASPTALPATLVASAASTRVVGKPTDKPFTPASIPTVTPAARRSPVPSLAPSAARPSPTASPRVPYATAPSASEPAGTPKLTGFDAAALQRYMLELVNQDRQAASLTPVRWDDIAARAGALHTEEMARNLYFSHWNEAGLGPDHRYALAGGLDSVMENIHMHMHTPGFGPQTADEWRSLVREAEQSLMNSPGHRANILKPEHTHVGIGIAYNAAAGRFLMTQEFTNHYVTLQPIPASVSLGGTITLQGKLEPGASAPLINLAYEPFPQPRSVANLNQTSTYSSPAQTYEAVTLDVDADGKFSRSLKLNNGGQAGFYHVRVWVESRFGRVLVADPIVRVQ